MRRGDQRRSPGRLRLSLNQPQLAGAGYALNAEVVQLDLALFDSLAARAQVAAAAGQPAAAAALLSDGLAMLALYRLGCRADALNLYLAGRQVMVAELGLEPGPQLRRLHQRILVDDEGCTG